MYICIEREREKAKQNVWVERHTNMEPLAMVVESDGHV